MKLDELNDVLTPQDLIDFLPNHGRNKIYRLLKTGTIKSKKCGRDYLILKDHLFEYIGVTTNCCRTNGIK